MVDPTLSLISADGAYIRSSKRPMALPMFVWSTNFRDIIHEHRIVSRTCLLNANEYNYKLRSVIGQEDENIRRAIGRLLDLVYAPSAGMRSSVGSTTSFFHTSMVVNTGSNDHLRIHKFIHEGLLSSLSKKQHNGKVSMNNAALVYLSLYLNVRV